MVKRISRDASDVEFWVRFLVGAHEQSEDTGNEKRRHGIMSPVSGYGSMVEHLVANQMMGVRFSLPAPKEANKTQMILHFIAPSEVRVWAFPYSHKNKPFKPFLRVFSFCVESG